MFVQKDIIDIEIDNIKYSAIAFNDKNCELPSFLLQGEKKPGFIYKNGELTPWYWEGFTNYEGKKCLYFAPIKLYPLSQISSTLRGEAPKLIINLATALSLLDSKFLDLQNGILSAWRIFFTEDDGVLILPRTLSDIFSSTADQDKRFDNANSFIHANLLNSFTLIDQMTQLLYYSITSIKPFEYSIIRTNHYNALSLQLLTQALDIKLDSDLIEKIDKILHLSLSKMRDISSNYQPQVALKWFIERFKDLSWDLENTEDKKINVDDLEANEVTKNTIQKIQKKCNRIIFWRKRGALIAVITVISVFVISFVGSRIHEALQPPYTYEMNQEQIIEAYYDAQNDLDVSKLEASLKRGTKSPITNEITTLFVTRQTRMAYEQVDSVLNPETWVKDNMPPIDNKKMIYGIDNVSITQIGENQYLATSTYYSPYPLQDSSDTNEDEPFSDNTQIFKCYRFEQKEIFTFDYNDRGWYEISQITPTEMKYIDTLLVPTYNPSDISYDIDNDTRTTESIVEQQYIN